jgi:hypothetical protein
VVGLAAVALAAAGCGAKVIDSARAEQEIRQSIEQQTGIRLAGVDCPDDVEARQGDRFECTARGRNGRTAPIAVRQTDDEGGIQYRAADLTLLR